MDHTNWTSRRQHGLAAAFALTACLVAALPFASPASAFDERIIYDPYSGLSIGGYDPVAYFTDGRARRGEPDFEVVVGDTYWHFVSEANATAFKADPLAYVPGFGGYSVGSLGRHVAAPGDPTIFSIYKKRVYLFMSAVEKTRFDADPATAIADATAAWPDILKLLAY